MSKTPEELPKRTRVLVKDILFQEKYRLTHTQVDIMAYILNCLTWTPKVGAFFPVTNKKIHQDLPQISEKTIEESLRALKAMELIEVQMITVPKWDNAYVRGISIFPKGLEYNTSFYRADESVIIENLKETEFYINSYNKLTVLNPSGKVAQLKNPIEIGDFLKYLSEHREQIGKIIDFTKKLDVDELNKRYVQMDIVLNEMKFKVQKIEEVKDGVQVVLKNSENGNIAMLSKDGEAIIFEVEACEKVLLGLRD